MKQIEKLSTGAGEVMEWVDDDRVLCQNCCKPVEVVMTQNMPAEQLEKHRKVNSKPLQWMFDQAKVRNGWARLTWTEQQCGQTNMATFPADVKHRCHMFQAKPAAVESDSWWLT